MTPERVQDELEQRRSNEVDRAEAKPILVVGGSGFVGQHVVSRLVEGGRSSRVLTRNPDAVPAIRHERVELVKGSHLDLAALDTSLRGVDAVVHLAKGEGRNWQEYLDNDVAPTLRLAQAAQQHGVRRFIYVGSIDCYASADPHTTIDGATSVDPAIDRRNHYARSKATCERVLMAMARDEGLPLVILRLGIVIGAGSAPIHYGVGRFSAWNRLTYWGDGRHHLPFVLVEDAADAIMRALYVEDIEQRSFLIADAPLLSARDYVQAMTERSGSKVSASARSLWRYWLADLARGLVKTALHHPNRHLSTLHDWKCRAHRSRFDASESTAILGWRPAGSREALIEKGIYPSVDAVI